MTMLIESGAPVITEVVTPNGETLSLLLVSCPDLRDGYLDFYGWFDPAGNHLSPRSLELDDAFDWLDDYATLT